MADTIDTYRTLTPYLVVADADAEIRFLEAAFGATVTSSQRHADGSVMHAELAIGNSQVMLGQAGDQWKPREAACVSTASSLFDDTESSWTSRRPKLFDSGYSGLTVNSSTVLPVSAAL